MAGGTWVDQNKIRPGVYINYKSAPSSLATMGERGVVAIARVLDWGERGSWYTITDPSDCEQFGHSITDAECLFIRQILLGTNRTQGASKILLWSLATPLEDGVWAELKVTLTDDTILRLSPASDYNGSAGNRLALSISKVSNKYRWEVYLDGNVVAYQDLTSSVSELNEDMLSYIDLYDPSQSEASCVPKGDSFPKTSFSGGLDGGNRAECYLTTSTSKRVWVRARYFGKFGNRLSMVVTSDGGSGWIVQTLLDGQAVHSQVVDTTDQLEDNDYVVFDEDTKTPTRALVANTGVSLAGGTDGEAGISNYSDFMDALEVQKFDIVIYDGTDATTKSSFASFVKDLSDNEGAKCQAVMSDYPNPDSECVISVYPQAVTLVDGTTLANEQLTWWVGGASAGAKPNESLTYTKYTDAVSVSPLLTSAQQKAAIQAGQLCVFADEGDIKILTDINCFRTLRVEKGQAFKKNRVIRTIFGICNDIYKAFSAYYIGAVDNDDEGRKSLKAEVLNILNRYQGLRALQNVDAEDVTVLKGVDSDAVVIEIYIQPVDSVEKIYINITIS